MTRMRMREDDEGWCRRGRIMRRMRIERMMKDDVGGVEL